MELAGFKTPQKTGSECQKNIDAVKSEQNSQQPIQLHQQNVGLQIRYNENYEQMLKKEEHDAQEKKALEDMMSQTRGQTSLFFRRNVERVQKMKTPISKKMSCSRSTPYSTAKKAKGEKNGRESKPVVNRSLLADFQSLSLSDAKM